MTWNLQKVNQNGVTQGPIADFNLFVCNYQDQQHFAYMAETGIIWDSWYDGQNGTWNLQQINQSGVTQGPKAYIAGSLFVCNYQDQLHFAYMDETGAIWDSWYDGQK